jgi:hypothetical protein
VKLYQLPTGTITTIGPFVSREEKTMIEIGDTDDGWLINTGTMPHKDAMVEVVFREGRTASGPRAAEAYYWTHEDQSGDIMAYRIITPKPAWPITMAHIAAQEGWEIADRAIRHLEGGADKFGTDEAAVLHVAKMANGGSFLHSIAFGLHRSPSETFDVKLTRAELRLIDQRFCGPNTAVEDALRYRLQALLST